MKLQANQILSDGVKLTSVKISEDSNDVKNWISETRIKQNEVNKLREVKQDQLRMVVKL